MNVLIIMPEQYRGDVIHFTDRAFNATNESAFSRVAQCDDCVMITGISVLLPLSNVDKFDRVCKGPSSCRFVSNYASYNKKNAYNVETTRNIQYIEQDILKQYGRTFDVLDKNMCLGVSDSLMCGKIKIANYGGNDSEGRDGYDCEYDKDPDNDNGESIHVDNDEYSKDDTSDKSDDFQLHRRISNIVLKISGIWETEFEYGLTYKYYF